MCERGALGREKGTPGIDYRPTPQTHLPRGWQKREKPKKVVKDPPKGGSYAKVKTWETLGKNIRRREGITTTRMPSRVSRRKSTKRKKFRWSMLGNRTFGKKLVVGEEESRQKARVLNSAGVAGCEKTS